MWGAESFDPMNSEMYSAAQGSSDWHVGNVQGMVLDPTTDQALREQGRNYIAYKLVSDFGPLGKGQRGQVTGESPRTDAVGEGMNTDDILKSYMDNVSAQQNDIKESIRASEERIERQIDRLIASVDQQERRHSEESKAQEERFNKAIGELKDEQKETTKTVKSMFWTTVGIVVALIVGIVALFATMMFGLPDWLEAFIEHVMLVS